MLKLFKYLKPYIPIIILALLGEFISSMMELLLPAMMSSIVDTGIVNADINFIWKTGAKMLGIALVGVAFNIMGSFFASKSSMSFGRDMRKKVFEKVSNFSMQEIDRFGTSSLVTRSTNDITQVQQIVFSLQRMMAKAPFMAIGGIIMALITEPRLSWILLVIIPFLIIAILLIAKKALPLFKSIQKKVDNINRVMRENLSGLRVVRAFDMIKHEEKRFDDVNVDLTSTSLKVNKIMSFLFPFVNFVMNFATVIIVWIGGIEAGKGNVSIGSLMAFIQYVSQIMFSVIMVSMIFVMIPRAQVSAERISEVLDVEPQIKDPKESKHSKENKGLVEFKNVSFSYSNSGEKALQDISFVAEPGKTTAIIGGTGSGKSTLLNLLMRFYDTSEGEILIDGINIKDMNQHELRMKTGYATQKAILFSGTISENLTFGDDSKTEADIQKAVEIAQASSFIKEKDEGFNYQLSQGGTNVSGGQKQRLAIARALTRKPEIYLFDDSFSALDFKTDAKLRASLNKETNNATVIIVAQRVNTIRNADQIIVLDEGKIVGKGTHKDLFNSCKTYREIVDSQLSTEEAI